MDNRFPAKCGAQPLFPPDADELIDVVERSLGTLLPDDYREFLLEWNGVEFETEPGTVVGFPCQPVNDHSEHVPPWRDWLPDPQVIRWWEGDAVGTVEELYGVSDGRKSHREAYLRSKAELQKGWDQASIDRCIRYHFDLNLDAASKAYREWVPKRFLPIGADPCNRVFISLAAPDRGQIYLWRTPVEAAENGPNMELMSWVAPNFSEF